MSVRTKASINYSREKYSGEKSSVLYVRGKHCGLPGFPGSMRTSQKEEIGFSHTWKGHRNQVLADLKSVSRGLAESNTDGFGNRSCTPLQSQ